MNITGLKKIRFLFAAGLAFLGMAVALKMGRPASPVVVLSTAHPAKFPEAVAQAIGVPPPEPATLSGLRKLPERVEPLANSPSLIKNFIFSRLIS